MLIHFLAPRGVKTHYFLYPLRAFRQQIQDQGLSVRINYGRGRSLLNCDVLCVLGAFFRGSRANSEDIQDFLRRCRRRVKHIVWFDTSASTGTTKFQFLPYVNLYAKMQLLRERQRYTTFHGARVYTDYYHNRHGMSEDIRPRRTPAPAQLLHKLAISWNSGLGGNSGFGDYTTFSRVGRLRRVFWPWTSYRPRPSPADSAQRDIGASYRASNNSGLRSVSFYRQLTRDLLAQLAIERNEEINFQGKVSYRRYMAELRRACVAPSPFGLGEICFRDFEVFLAGACLVKPDISHLETWPNYFEPGVTYVPHDWSFCDFQNKVTELLDSPATRQRVAQAGQNRYLASVSQAGGELFARHFEELMQKAMADSSG